MQEITPELLHSYGFQSYLDDDEPWWVYDDTWILYYDYPEKCFLLQKQDWQKVKYWEEFLNIFLANTNAHFKPKEPILNEYLWLYLTTTECKF